MEGTQQQERIRVELVRQALKLAPIAIIATPLNAFILVLVLWQHISHKSLLIWFSITICLAVLRSLFLYKYPGASLQPHQAAKVAGIFVKSMGQTGMGSQRTAWRMGLWGRRRLGRLDEITEKWG